MKISVRQLRYRAIAQHKAIAAEGAATQSRRVFMRPIYGIVHLYPTTDNQTFEFNRVNPVSFYCVCIHLLSLKKLLVIRS